MGLTNSLLIGRSALNASQLAVQVAGENLANAATPGYNRRVATLAPIRGRIDGVGVYTGAGVEVQSIARQVNEALIGRLRGGISEQQASVVDQEILSQVESLTSELGDLGLGTQLSEFLDAFSELANNPNSAETRALIVEQGRTLTSFIQSLRSDLLGVRGQVEDRVATNVERADELLQEIATLNVSIATSEQGRAEDAGLRDQRDALLEELSGLMDISAVEQANGMVDVFVGSTPIVLGPDARGVEILERTTPNGVLLDVVVSSDGTKLRPEGGRIGALLRQRSGSIDEAIDDLDRLASAVIFEVNRRHSSGHAVPGLTSAASFQRTPAGDQALALNDPANATFAGLPFAAQNGSFVVIVTDQATGQTTETEITIDLDGIDASGAAGFGDDASVASIVAALDGVANLSATINPSGQVVLQSSAGFEYGFRDDTSGALAVLGVNTFFTGEDAANIDVRAELRANPQLVVAGVSPGSNEAALSIAQLRESSVDLLGGVTLQESWRRTSERIAVETRGATTRAQASTQIRGSLEAQRQAVSGVSVDEETLNLLNYQRQYQAAARFINTVDEMTQILVSLI